MSRPTLAEWRGEDNKGYGEANMPPELWDVQQAVLALRDRLRERAGQRRQLQVVPEVLYHYTDICGLLGILTSFKLWLSDATYMNDPGEGIWVLKLALAVATQVLGDTALGQQTCRQIRA
jgi:hypothetical protein